MNKLAHWQESHLLLKEKFLAPGGEWLPGLPGWLLIRVGGPGYWLEAKSSTELEAGTVVLVAGGGSGCIRASQLNGLTLHYFNLIPARLTGLITMGELDFFKRAGTRQELALQVIQPHDPVSQQMSALCAEPNREGLLVRLNLLRLMVGLFGADLGKAKPPQKPEQGSDAKERLREFLRKTPSDALLEINFNELAQMTHCTSRHLSRIFYDLVGMSFRDKRAEIRLARARELLATSQTKMVEVAMESGYNSLSLFNLMFTRRFGITPSKWRQKNGAPAGTNGNSKGRRPAAKSNFALIKRSRVPGRQRLAV